MERDDVIAILNDLIETSLDGEEGFRTAADNVKNPILKEFFQQKAERCHDGAAQLQTLVRQMGGEAEDSSSTSGAVHRFWLSIRSAISGMDDHAMLDECERGEDVAKKAYEEALQLNLPANVRVIVDRQHSEILATHDRVRELRNMTA
jgi:uncharacterized protein (TIGR02284 family)